MERRAVLWFKIFAVTLWATSAMASEGRQVDVAERMRGAHKVVVAKAVSVAPEWRTNAHGDRLIVSQVALQVEETLKGTPASLMWLEVEGGTLDGVTLVVSSLPPVKAGDRAVFLLDATASGTHVPHLKGMGILKLDAANHIQGSTLRLDDIRRLAASAGR